MSKKTISLQIRATCCLFLLLLTLESQVCQAAKFSPTNISAAEKEEVEAQASDLTDWQR